MKSSVISISRLMLRSVVFAGSHGYTLLIRNDNGNTYLFDHYWSHAVISEDRNLNHPKLFSTEIDFFFFFKCIYFSCILYFPCLLVLVYLSIDLYSKLSEIRPAKSLSSSFQEMGKDFKRYFCSEVCLYLGLSKDLRSRIPIPS